MRILNPIEYFEPETVEEALQILATHGEKAQVLAGGVHLVPCLRRREIAPECISLLE